MERTVNANQARFKRAENFPFDLFCLALFQIIREHIHLTAD
jgi:hypothetical protein